MRLEELAIKNLNLLHDQLCFFIPRLLHPARCLAFLKGEEVRREEQDGSNGGKEGQDAAVIVCHHQHWGKKKKIKRKGPGVGPTPQLVAMTDNTTKAKGAARLYVLLSVLSLFFTLRVASHPVGCQDVRSHSLEQFGRWRGGSG